MFHRLYHLLDRRRLARLCLAFLAGNALAVAPHQLGRPVAYALFAAILCLLVVVQVYRHHAAGSEDSRSWFSGFTGIACLTAFILAHNAYQPPPEDISRWSSAHLARVFGTVATPIHHTDVGDSFELECTEIWCGDTGRQVTGRIEVWVPGPFFGHRRPAEFVRWPEQGQPAEVKGVLQRLEAGKNPWDDHLRNQRIFAELRVGKGGTVRPTGPPEETLTRWCHKASDWLLDGLAPFLSRVHREALGGMLFHHKDEMDPAVLDDLQKTGTIHIVATAGLHVGIFLGTCLLVFKYLLPRRGAVLITMALLPGYCLACGAWPAVVRATWMAELALLAWLLGRLPDGITTLSLVAVLMDLLNPLALLDAGFQFTFLTVTVIVLVMPLLVGEQKPEPGRGPWGWVKRKFREAAGLSIGAQLGSWPLTALYFGVISPIGVVANMLIVPLLMAIIPLALWTSLAAHLVPWLAIVPSWFLNRLIGLLLGLAHWMAHLPGASFNFKGVQWPAVMLAYGAMLAALVWLHHDRAEPPVSAGDLELEPN